MVCPKCGAEIDDDCMICPICGDEMYTNVDQNPTVQPSKDASGTSVDDTAFPRTPTNISECPKNTPKIWYLLGVVILLFVGYQFVGRDALSIGKGDEESSYEIILSEIQKEIDELVDSDYSDTDRIKTDYELLLGFRIDEYMFKSMAYGHFTGEYDADKFDSEVKQVEKTMKEMARFYESEELQQLYQLYAKESYAKYDDDYFNYEDETFEHSYPDIDKMWIEYIDRSVKARMEQS